jgi:uncharacterized caspase-like protein
MANHACVAIGINRYQFLPPLNYGQADAQALRQFLVCQANLPSNECLLLTDTSPLADDQSTYPSRENIWRWIEAQGQNSRNSANWRWFFFSGYGLNWENVDYLMPIDGNLDDVPGTAIPVRSLFASLKAQGSDNILVLLDINRSPGLQYETIVGAETVELAHQMGISLVLSSQLGQFSHEATGLGNGLFTAALLEALRYYHIDITLEHLDQYLHARLPELCQHHWRPAQTPLTVIPSEKARQQFILPTARTSPTNQQSAPNISNAFIPRTTLETKEVFSENLPNGAAVPVQTTTGTAVETRPIKPLDSTIPAGSHQAVPTSGAMIPYPNKRTEPDSPKSPFWQQLLLWGGGALLLLVLMVAPVILRNWNTFVNQQPVKPPTAKETATQPPLSSANPSSTDRLNPSAKASVGSSQASPMSRLQVNQTTLEQAKRLLRPNQASLFNKAIVEARKVKSGDPLYQQAQQDIKRWSEVILDIAEGRAEKENFELAIAAAQFVPKDNPSVHTKAQQAINQWKVLATQQQQHKIIIEVAKKQIQPNQASSYNRAIRTLRKISPGQPGYAEAQQLTEQWSKTIYQIAQSRASKGKFQEAIQTATLIPADTTSAEEAQKAIANWKQAKK